MEATRDFRIPDLFAVFVDLGVQTFEQRRQPARVISGALRRPYYRHSASPKKPNSHTCLRQLAEVPRAGLEPAEESRSSQSLAGITTESEAVEVNEPDPRGSSAEPTVTLSHDEIRRALDDARHAWARSADVVVLRRALLELLQKLGGVQ